MSNASYYIDHKSKSVLIWSPKCACSTLKKYFVKHICKININSKFENIVKKNIISCNDYNKIPKNYRIYWGVRDPFERIVSCYINKFIHYQGERISEKKLEPFSSDFLKNTNIKYKNLTFNKFLQAIKKTKNRRKNLDIHFDTQVNKNNYNIIKNYPKLVIFDIKNMSKIFRYNFNKSNSSSYNSKSKKMDITNISAIKISLNNLNKENFKKSINLIKNIYKIDYDLFNNKDKLKKKL